MSGSIHHQPLIKILLSTVFMCSVMASTWAADISGKVTVLKKGGKKALRSFEHAVIYLEGIDSPAPEKPAVMKQVDKQFVPRLLPIIKGQIVHFVNGDRIRHNVFSPDEKEQFDLGRYPKGQFKPWTFKTLGQHKIYCNIHQQMIGDVFVLTNKYFAVTAKDGSFTIKGIPAGKYKLKTWHIYGGASSQDIEVTAENKTLNLSITSTKVVREIEDHQNKDGDDYDDDDDY